MVVDCQTIIVSGLKMSYLEGYKSSRRGIVRTGSLMLASFVLVSCSRRHAGSTSPTAAPSPQPLSLSPTPACGDEPTPPQTAGPFYTPNSPQRASLLEQGLAGSPIILSGQILSTNCEPIANALVDFWHTNDRGEYDNNGYTFRGHQFTDTGGYYRLETILPGIYSGRTRHIHVRVQAPNRPILTTQLYFPEEPLNQDDFLFRSELLVALKTGTEYPQAQFNFVLA